MASRMERRLGPTIAAFVGLVYAAVVGWTRSRALSAGVLEDAHWVRALEAGQRLEVGQVASVTFGSSVGPAQQAVAAISLLGGPSVGAAVLCGVSACIAVAGAVLLCRDLKGPSRAVVMVSVVLLALRADVLALPGLLLIGVALEMGRPTARPAHAWRLGALLLLAVAWAPWACAPVALLVTVASAGRPKLAVRAAAVLVVGVALWLGLSALVGSVDGATWLGSESRDSGTWALVVWLFGSWIWMVRQHGSKHATHLAMLLAASALSLLLGQDPYALVWPSAVAAAVVATQADVLRPIRICMALAATVLVLAEIFAPVVGRVEHGFAFADPSPLAVEDRVVAWMDGGSGCVLAAGDIGHAAVRSRTAVIPATVALADSASAGGRGLCPRAVVRGASAIAPALLPIASNYEPLVRLGADTYGLRRRRRSIEVLRWAIVTDTSIREIESSELVSVSLPDPLAGDALLRVEIMVESDDPPRRVSVRAGGPWIRFDEEGVALVPVRASATLARFMGGAAASSSEVDHLEIRARGRSSAHDPVRLRVRGLAEVLPPSEADAAAAVACMPVLPLHDVFTSGRASVRPTADGFTIAPGPASIDALVTTCADACLYAQVGLVGDAGSREVRVVVERDGRASTLVHRLIGPSFRQPIEVPLAAGPLALRFRFDGEGELAVHEPRIAPCVSLVSVVNALHEGRARHIPDDIGIATEGDELRLPVLLRNATPPRVEIDVELSAGTDPCVAVELSVRDRAGPVGLLVGIEEEDHVYWLSRLVLEPGAEPEILKDLAIGRFIGDATLVFSAWSLGGGGGGVAVFTRPQVHTCGKRLEWAF